MPGARHQYVVLDSHAAPPRHINARLDSHNHPRLKLGLLAHSQSGRFMNLQASAVPQPMPECFTEARSSNDLPCDAVDLLASHVGSNSVNRRELRFEHNSIYLT